MYIIQNPYLEAPSNQVGIGETLLNINNYNMINNSILC